MTREEIVKALRCCNSETECRGCPFEQQEPLLLGLCAEKVLAAAADMLEQDAEHNPADIDEICALHARAWKISRCICKRPLPSASTSWRCSTSGIRACRDTLRRRNAKAAKSSRRKHTIRRWYIC